MYRDRDVTERGHAEAWDMRGEITSELAKAGFKTLPRSAVAGLARYIAARRRRWAGSSRSRS